MAALSEALEALYTGSDKGKELGDDTVIAPGLVLRADPACALRGHWRSPAGRLLEIEAWPEGRGAWIGLHVELGTGVTGDWLGLVCRSAAPAELMARPVLRSGTGDGFVDTPLPRHILSLPEPLTHADALHLPTTPDLPATAPWRELVIFLPEAGFSWHLHDLRILAP